MRHLASLLLGSGLVVCTACAQHSATTAPPTAPVVADTPVAPPPQATDAQLHPMRNQPAATPGKAQAVMLPTKVGAPVIVFKKTPCFGTCPHYTATIYPDGRVEYEGIRFVKLEGKHRLQMPEAIISAVLQKANELDFSQLQDQYLAGVSDLPSTYLTLPLADGTTKTVVAEPGRNTPPALQDLLAYISTALDQVTGNGAAGK